MAVSERLANAPRPFPQKTLGILGGSSDKATGEFYKRLNEAVNARLGGWETAECVIVSMNFGNIEHYLRTDDWAGCRDYVSGKVDRIIASGADCVMVLSNTLHRVLEPIMATQNLPFLHVADCTGVAIKQAGLSRIALFGTKPTMATPYMRECYERRFGFDILVPTEDEQNDIDRIIFDELCMGKIEPRSKARYLEISDRLAGEGAQGLILGCTEICLLIDQPDRPDFPMFDTTQLHVNMAVDFALGDKT